MGERERKGTARATTSASGATAPPLPNLIHEYGTFQGVAYCTRPPPQSVLAFPQPAPPPYGCAYHTVPGYAVVDGRPLRDPRLPFCGIGVGWFLFVIGFFLAAIPWYVGALLLLCGRVDYREKPGLVACMVASILAVIAIVFGVTNGADFW